MEQYKQQIINKGYELIAETEDGFCFANENTSFGVILLREYSSKNDARAGHKLHEILKNKYSFAEKSTICIIASIECNEDKDREDLERNEYYFLKIFPERINILPEKRNKEIQLTFVPMSNENDVGNYHINPFEKLDGLACVNFLEYLCKAQNNDIIKYPAAINIGFFNYWAYKLYKTEVIK